MPDRSVLRRLNPLRYPLRFGSLRIEMYRPEWMAPLDVLRRRTYCRIFRLPRGRYLIVSYLPL